MTNEEKLLKLLQIAVDNGWESPLKTPFEKCKIKAMRTAPLAYEIDPTFENDEMWIFIHLNDLVTNWEEGEVSFIEALCKKTLVKDFYSIQGVRRPIPDEYRLQWVLKPTSQRLDWLFETFKHLL